MGAPVDRTILYDIGAGRVPPVCQVDEHDVITFDQSHYHWQPSSCWTTLVADATVNKVGGIWTRFHEGEWQVKGMWVTEGLTWEMTPTVNEAMALCDKKI